MAQTRNFPKRTVPEILMNNLDARSVCKDCAQGGSGRVETCQKLWDLCESEPHFLDNVLTGDESWVFGYGAETKMQIAQRHTSASSWPQKARFGKSKGQDRAQCVL